MPKVVDLDALAANRQRVSIGGIEYEVQPVNALILEAIEVANAKEGTAKVVGFYAAAAQCLPGCARAIIDGLTLSQITRIIEMAQEQVDAVNAATDPGDAEGNAPAPTPPSAPPTDAIGLVA